MCVGDMNRTMYNVNKAESCLMNFDSKICYFTKKYRSSNNIKTLYNLLFMFKIFDTTNYKNIMIIIELKHIIVISILLNLY